MSSGQTFNAPSGFESSDAPNGTSQFNARSHISDISGSFASVIGFGTVPNTIQSLSSPRARELGPIRSDTHPRLEGPAQTQVALLVYGPTAGGGGVPSVAWEEAKLYFQWIKKTFINSWNGSCGFGIVASSDANAIVHGSGLDAAISGPTAGGNNYGFLTSTAVNPVSDAAATIAGGFGGSFRDKYQIIGASNFVPAGGSVFVSTPAVNETAHYLHMTTTYGIRQAATGGTSVNTAAWVGNGAGGGAGAAPNPHMWFAGKMEGPEGYGVENSPYVYDRFEADTLPTGVSVSSNTPGAASVSWTGATLLTPAGSRMYGVHWSTDPDLARHGFGTRVLNTGGSSLDNQYHASPAFVDGLPPGEVVYFGVSVDRCIRPQIFGTGVGSASLDNTVPTHPTDPRSATASTTVMA